MPKLYRLTLDQIDPDGAPVKSVYFGTDTGYYISHLMKSLAKKIYEPAPAIKLEGQEEIQL